MTQAGDDAIALAEAMTRHWQGHAPGIIGAALAQALAIFLASHPKSARDGVLDLHIEAVRRMVPVLIRERGLDDP